MALGRRNIRPDHNGAKNGSESFYGLRKNAKAVCKKLRRIQSKELCRELCAV